MAAADFSEVINSLTPAEQASVMEFIVFLRARESAPSPFLNAAQEFIEQHPELLRHLAQ